VLRSICPEPGISDVTNCAFAAVPRNETLTHSLMETYTRDGYSQVGIKLGNVRSTPGHPRAARLISTYETQRGLQRLLSCKAFSIRSAPVERSSPDSIGEMRDAKMKQNTSKHLCFIRLLPSDQPISGFDQRSRHGAPASLQSLGMSDGVCQLSLRHTDSAHTGLIAASLFKPSLL
jgi:hypothetical protein